MKSKNKILLSFVFGIMIFLLGINLISSSEDAGVSSLDIVQEIPSLDTNINPIIPSNLSANERTSIYSSKEEEKNSYLKIYYYNETKSGNGKEFFASEYLNVKRMCNEIESISSILKQEKCSFSINGSKKEPCPTNDESFLEICYEEKLLGKKPWGSLCSYDFECGSDFCHEGKCYRGGESSYYASLEDKNAEFEEKLKDLEEKIEENEKEDTTNKGITGAVVEDTEKQNFFRKLWRKIFSK